MICFKILKSALLLTLILVFAEKNRKNKVMSKVMENIEDISSMPARILTNATWLI